MAASRRSGSRRSSTPTRSPSTTAPQEPPKRSNIHSSDATRRRWLSPRPNLTCPLRCTNQLRCRQRFVAAPRCSWTANRSRGSRLQHSRSPRGPIRLREAGSRCAMELGYPSLLDSYGPWSKSGVSRAINASERISLARTTPSSRRSVMAPRHGESPRVLVRRAYRRRDHVQTVGQLIVGNGQRW